MMDCGHIDAYVTCKTCVETVVNNYKIEIEELKKQVTELNEEIERLKACRICHRPFVGSIPHVNCGDTINCDSGKFSQLRSRYDNEDGPLDF